MGNSLKKLKQVKTPKYKLRFFLFLHQILQLKRIDSSVMMWIQIRAWGVRGHAALEIIYKNGAMWRILSAPKYVIINLKMNNFKNYKSTLVKIIRHIVNQYLSIIAC